MPSFLSGYYMYTKNELSGSHLLDTATVSLFLTAWNTSTGKADTVGLGRYDLGYAASYTGFNCQVTYSSATPPDSVTIYITPSKWQSGGSDCRDSAYCSFLTIDNLSLLQKAAVPLPYMRPATLYPNPVKDVLTITQYYAGTPQNIQVHDITGHLIYMTTTTQEHIIVSTENWPAGIYILLIMSANNTPNYYKIIKG